MILLLLFRFFQELFETEKEIIGLLFFNFNSVEKDINAFLSVTTAEVDGTYKTIQKLPPQFNMGCYMSM